MNWQLNKILYPIYNLGEGKRIGIWVQGCNLGCKGCITKLLWNKNGGKSVSVVDIFNWLTSIQAGFDGITLVGGEPFQQYEQLISFLHLIKTKTKLSVHCFSGYYLHELEKLFPDKLYSKYIDTLIDGRYIQEKHESKNIKGSTNQTVYNFIDEIPIERVNIKVSNKLSIKVSKDNQIVMTGIPKKNELDNLSNDLLKVGIKKTFK